MHVAQMGLKKRELFLTGTTNICFLNKTRSHKITWRKSKNVSGIRLSMYAVSLEKRFRIRPVKSNQETRHVELLLE